MYLLSTTTPPSLTGGVSFCHPHALCDILAVMSKTNTNRTSTWVHDGHPFAKAMIAAGWTQMKFSEASGIAQGTISRYCAGLRRPNATNLKNFARLLGVSPSEVAAMFPLDERESIVVGK